MPEEKKYYLTEEQKKFLARPMLRFEPMSPEELAAEKKAAAEKAAKAVAKDKIGYAMPDGTIYAGISPDTKKPMYTTPADAPLGMTFDKSMEYASSLETHGHKDWRMPTKGELGTLFNNRAAIGGFNETCAEGWYWYNTIYDRSRSYIQQFSDGSQRHIFRGANCFVRCVR